MSQSVKTRTIPKNKQRGIWDRLSVTVLLILLPFIRHRHLIVVLSYGNVQQTSTRKFLLKQAGEYRFATARKLLDNAV